jgi:uncharacterized repeat protein (TIGR03803 family)
MKSSFLPAAWRALQAFLVLGPLCAGSSHAGDAPTAQREWRYEIVHEFENGDLVGTGHLVRGSDGRLYGAASGSGFSAGKAFRMSSGGRFALLHQFSFDDGGPANPLGHVEASDGHLYGVSRNGGAFGYGSVYRMNRHGDVVLLYSFNPADGGCHTPGAPMILASDGCFYGITTEGGAGTHGCIYRMSKDGAVTFLHEFNVDKLDGRDPTTALVEASDGLIYGTTSVGGRHLVGTVFRLNHRGFYQVVHSFHKDWPGNDGSYPNSALVPGPDGQLYGTTSGWNGTLYKVALGREVSLVHVYGEPEGPGPRGTLSMAGDGTITGATYYGADHAAGGIYQRSPGGQIEVLHSFEPGLDGRAKSGPTAMSEDDFYGFTDLVWGAIYRIHRK